MRVENATRNVNKRSRIGIWQWRKADLYIQHIRWLYAWRIEVWLHFLCVNPLIRYDNAGCYHFYRASICEGGLGSRNSVRLSVRPSVCPSVCHTRAL